MAFQTGGKIVYLNAKSAWAKVSIPAADDFADLVEFQELNDYEFVNKPIGSAKKRKKKRLDHSEENLSDVAFNEEFVPSETANGKQKGRQKQVSHETSEPLAKKLKALGVDKVMSDLMPPAGERKKKKRKKKKMSLNVTQVTLLHEKDENGNNDSPHNQLAEKPVDVPTASSVTKKKKKRKKKTQKKVKQVVAESDVIEPDKETTSEQAKIEEEDLKTIEAAAGNDDEMGEQTGFMDSMEGWKMLGLSSELLQALLEQGFTEPTPIQSITLPYAINHRLDIIGAAQTGSGKTLAFGLPILQYILNNWQDCESPDGPVALILEPTRELTVQVHNHLKHAACHTKIKIMTIVGQMAVEKQQRLLAKKPQIIVATPGRLWELIQSGEEHLQNLHKVRQFVLDEADRLTETNHFEEVHNIISRLQVDNDGKRRQHFIFSATLMLDHAKPQRLLKKMRRSDIKDTKQKLQDLVAELGIQGKPKHIDLSRKEGTADTLTETCIACLSTEKDLYLYYLLRKYGGRTLVFCNSKDCIRRLISIFKLLGRNPLPLHSDMRQPQRLKNLDNFGAHSPSLLLATDVAARGLDIRGVDHVVHYQVPFTVEKYIHRSGRTARASRVGLSVVLISPEESKMYRNIMKLNEGESLPPFPVDTHVIETLRPHIKLATQIDKEDHTLRKDKVNNNWMLRAAREADLELDDVLLVKDEDGQRQRLEKKLKQQKHQLEAMMREPLYPSTFSGRYPTQTGHLVLPEQFATGSNAVNDCSKLKKRK